MGKDKRLIWKGTISRKKENCPEVCLNEYPYLCLYLPVTPGVLDERELKDGTVVDIIIKKERKKKAK